MLSDKFLARLKMSEIPAYKLAVRAGVSPSWLSMVIHGARRVERGDVRLLRIARALGLDEAEMFSDSEGVDHV
jgi:transcriptional regulator with XRE-family HTH domain